MSYIGERDFALEVAEGNVSGYATLDKFGQTTDADSGVDTDIWDGADGVTSTDIWVAPTQARVHAIVSGSLNDSDTGGANPQSTGMRTIRVYGLQTWSSAESSEDVILDGTTAVNTSNSYVIIHRMKGLTWGSGQTNAGIITATAATDGTVTAAIQAGENQTLMAIYGVPDTKTIHISHGYATVLKAGGASGVAADGTILVMENAGTVNSGWITKDRFHFSDSVPWDHDFKTYKTFVGPCVVKIQVNTETANSQVTGSFDAYVVDN